MGVRWRLRWRFQKQHLLMPRTASRTRALGLGADTQGPPVNVGSGDGPTTSQPCQRLPRPTSRSGEPDDRGPVGDASKRGEGPCAWPPGPQPLRGTGCSLCGLEGRAHGAEVAPRLST